jgi:hypothetical protein
MHIYSDLLKNKTADEVIMSGLSKVYGISNEFYVTINLYPFP